MDYLPSASLENLRLRATMLGKVREFFAAREFLEVETPVLSADVVVDRHLEPLSTVLPDDPRRPDQGRRMWLQTSPEFGMKRLLAAGVTAIYQITRAFRGDEIGRLHNPEFTMVEWYRVGDDMQAGMDLLSELAGALLDAPAVERLTYAQAFERRLGLDPHCATAADLSAAAKRAGLSSPAGLSDDRDPWLNFLLAECIEPTLGFQKPTILYDYPATQAALAQVEGDPPVARRFELYVRGVELANGYHELLDPVELLRRNQTANAARAAEGRRPLPEESRLLSAMEAGLPDCTGVAMGFDRVVMLAAGADSIAEVMAFTTDRA